MSPQERLGEGQQSPNACPWVQPFLLTGDTVTNLFLTVSEAEVSTDSGQRVFFRVHGQYLLYLHAEETGLPRGQIGLIYASVLIWRDLIL